jgi:hypothetical protein
MVQELKKTLWLEKYKAEDWTESGGGRKKIGWARDRAKSGRGIWQRLSEG